MVKTTRLSLSMLALRYWALISAGFCQVAASASEYQVFSACAVLGNFYQKKREISVTSFRNHVPAVQGPGAVQWTRAVLPEASMEARGSRNAFTAATATANEAGTWSCFSFFVNAFH